MMQFIFSYLVACPSKDVILYEGDRAFELKVCGRSLGLMSDYLSYSSSHSTGTIGSSQGFSRCGSQRGEWPQSCAKSSRRNFHFHRFKLNQSQEAASACHAAAQWGYRIGQWNRLRYIIFWIVSFELDSHCLIPNLSGPSRSQLAQKCHCITHAFLVVGWAFYPFASWAGSIRKGFIWRQIISLTTGKFLKCQLQCNSYWSR